METTLLLTTALSLVSPLLLKSGETFVEKATEDLYNLLKRPFSPSVAEQVFAQVPSESSLDEIKKNVLELLENDSNYRSEVERAVLQAQSSLNQQNINNNSAVTKQVNIQTNSGDLNF